MNLSAFPPISARRAGTLANDGRAFTLIELLTVMAIISVMMVAVVPALNGLKGAGDVTKAAYDLTGTLEQARAYAMANNTYVFVGITERDGLDAKKAGVGQILVVAMGSRDGTRGYGGNPSNLAPLTKARRIENVRLADSVPTTGNLSRPPVSTGNRVGNDAFVAQDSFESSGYTFTKIIQFDPRGMASIQSSSASVSPWIEVGLVGANGGADLQKANCAALMLDGVTGSAKIYRP
jgi:prepilin-type N-terminal cleavage/methylation domain-containing protein